MDARTKMVTALTLLSIGAILGCQNAGAPSAAPAGGADARPRAAQAPGEPEPMDPTVGSAGRDNLAATVNGEPITRDELFELMVADCGLDAAEQLIATAVVEQAAAEMNIAVTSEDVDAENRRTIERIAPDVSEADRQRVLAELLARRGISPQRWRMTMRRNAILAEIAARRITITDPMIRAEYNRTYGPKVEVRHIQSDSARQAMNVLDLYEAGADFGDLARQWSTNAQTAPRGGLIPPFSSDTEEAPAQIRQVAFELEEGQVSGVIQHLEDYHVIKLERTIPAQDVEYETVRDELRQRLRRRRIAAAQSDILLSLIRDADVRFHHPVLREQHQARTPMDAPREQ